MGPLLLEEADETKDDLSNKHARVSKLDQKLKHKTGSLFT